MTPERAAALHRMLILAPNDGAHMILNNLEREIRQTAFTKAAEIVTSRFIGDEKTVQEIREDILLLRDGDE